jgi:hypothetical protein
MTAVVCPADQVNAPKDPSKCVPCPPFTKKSGNMCVTAPPSIPKTPVDPGTVSLPSGNDWAGGVPPRRTSCPPGMRMGANGVCCAANHVGANGQCLVAAAPPVDRRQDCPEGYEAQGEYCVFVLRPEQPKPSTAMRCPPGLVPRDGGCVVPVVWREADLHPCPGGMTQVGRHCAAALQPGATPSRASCPSGYTLSGDYCVVLALTAPPTQNTGTAVGAASCDGARLPSGRCLSNTAVTVAAAGAGMAAVLATRRAARPAQPAGLSGTPALIRQPETPSGPTIGTGQPKNPGGAGTEALVNQPGTSTKGSATDGAPKGALKGTPALVKSNDQTKGQTKGNTLALPSGDDSPGAKAKPKKGKSPPPDVAIRNTAPNDLAPKKGTIVPTRPSLPKIIAPKIIAPKVTAPHAPPPKAPPPAPAIKLIAPKAPPPVPKMTTPPPLPKMTAPPPAMTLPPAGQPRIR